MLCTIIFVVALALATPGMAVASSIDCRSLRQIDYTRLKSFFTSAMCHVDHTSIGLIKHTALAQQMVAKCAKKALNKFFNVCPILSEAVRAGDHQLVYLLISCGAAVAQRGGKGNATALHYAAFEADGQMVQLLLDAGADVDSRADNNSTPLHWAAAGGRVDVVELLLNRGARVSPWSAEQQTPLHWAAIRGHEQVVRVLLDHGAYVCQRCKRDKSALDWAIDKDHVEVIRALVVRGAGMSKEGKVDPVLFNRLRSKNPQLYRECLEVCDAGNKLLRYVDYYVNPLSRVDSEAIRKLLDSPVDRDILYFRCPAKAKHGKTSWMRAIDLGFDDAVRVMLKAGADANSVGCYPGTTPLHQAARRGSAATVQILLEWGADVNARAGRQGTPLQVVLDGFKCCAYPNEKRKKLEDVAKMLVCAGAEVPARDKTALPVQDCGCQWPTNIEYRCRCKVGSALDDLYSRLVRLRFCRVWSVSNLLEQCGLSREVREIVFYY